MDDPTDYTEVNTLIRELLARVQETLGGHFISMYLDGSLANNDFDQASDIDFVVVTDQDISGDLFASLQVMHDRLAMIESRLWDQFEGSYISQHAIRRFDPEHALHPNIERGDGERLKMAYHAEDWAVHRHVLRERGITISGPPPQTLIDPVSPDDLRRAMNPLLDGWLPQFLNNPGQIEHRGYQSYIVLSLCRILYTLRFGEVVSKRAAADWAVDNLDPQWKPLIQRAWEGRQNGEPPLQGEELGETLDFICYIKFQRTW